jgi:hypothetical protein
LIPLSDSKVSLHKLHIHLIELINGKSHKIRLVVAKSCFPFKSNVVRVYLDGEAMANVSRPVDPRDFFAELYFVIRILSHKTHS